MMIACQQPAAPEASELMSALRNYQHDETLMGGAHR
jgi:hypothetical protein